MAERRAVLTPLGAVTGAVMLASVAGASAQTTCDRNEVIVTGESTDARFSVEIADDAGERALGLMNRSEMARSHGMLFVYEKPQPVAFWMANTLIPLDMIFTDRRGVVTRVHENAVPLDRTPIPGGDAVFAVLEINAGLAKRLGIAPGDVLRHPAFGPEAADPCVVQ
jgi:Uncharacterized conserved protein